MSLRFVPSPCRVLVLGGTGFVGRHLCEKLVRQGHRVTVPTRRLEAARRVQHLPGLTVCEADVHDATCLQQLLRGHDVAIHLVAILHGSDKAFHRAHVELPAKLVQACHAAGVRRLLHVSAIGVDVQAPSLYLRSKAAGEALVLASGLDVSVLRPSVIFGQDDRFTNLFASLQRLLPVVPLAGADARFQPVWVEDVATALVRLLELPPAQRPRIVEACGPQVLSLAQIVRISGARAGCARPVLPLPGWLGRVQALMMECLPGQPLMSRDNLRSMQVPSVASGAYPGLDSLGIRPLALA